MGLDINTPKGQQSLEDERLAAEIFEQHHHDLTYVHTLKSEAVVVDALLVRDRNQLAYVVETKCRYGATLEKLRGPWRNEWLVTASKVEGARRMAVALNVPLLGFLYLVDDEPRPTLLVQRLAHDSWQWCCEFRTAITTTPATINGGEANRLNAFINMAGARLLRR